VKSQQLLTESEVFEDEVFPGTKSADHPAEEMPEPHDHGKILSERSKLSFSPSHSFCWCTRFWRDTGVRSPPMQKPPNALSAPLFDSDLADRSRVE
jgi:hypothetical protein